MLIALVTLIKRKFDWRGAIKKNKWLIILVILMLVSIIWSSIPYISFKRWTRELAPILMAFVVFSEPSPQHALEAIFRRMTYIMIPFSILLIKYFPMYGRMYNPWTGEEMWIGVTLTKNCLGILCLTSGFFLIWSLVRRRQGNKPPLWRYQTHTELFLLAMTLFLIRGAKSATSSIALGIGLITYLSFYIAERKGIVLPSNMLALIVSVIILVGIVTPFTSASTVGSYAGFVGRNSTLTGRTDIWNAILPFIKHRIMLGLGFGSFWTTQTVEAIGVNESHNGYLGVIMEIGLAGLLLVSVFLLSNCRRAQQELVNNFDWGIIWTCFIIMFVIENIAESTMNDLASLLTSIIVFFSFLPEREVDG
jgi:O-antigen ligase